MPPQLPNELYRNIVGYVPGCAELATLCAVSPALRFEAERVLYHTVEILEYHRILSWSATVASSSRLASIVHSLTLPDATHPAPVVNEISQALRETTNLKYLTTKPPEVVSLSSSMCLKAKSLIGCGFRLYGLSGDLHVPQSNFLWWFLSEQSDIHSWVIGNSMDLHLPYLPDWILPNLSTLDLLMLMPSNLVYFHPRPIECLSIGTEWGSFGRLDLFKDTLTSLTCHYKGPPGMSIEDQLGSIAALVPDIKALHYNTFVLSTISNLESLAPSIAKFKALQTFTLFIATQSAHLCNDTNHAYDIARRFVASCPSLRLVTLEAQGAQRRRFAVRTGGAEGH